MKKSRTSILKIILLVLILSLLSACGRDDNSGDSSPSSPDYATDESVDTDAEQDQGSEGMLEGEKVISTYFMTLETLEFDKTRNDLENLIEENEAFIESSDISFSGYEYAKNYKHGSFSIRIPKDNIEIFIESLKDIANIRDESTNKEDVTRSYTDTESRLRLVESKEERLLELLERAVEIEDIIIIESELTDTIYQKERLERNLQAIDDKIDYTTLNLEMIEVRNFSNVESSNSSLATRLKAAFKDSWYSFKLAVENFFVWVVFALPYLIIIVPIIIVVLYFIRKRKKL